MLLLSILDNGGETFDRYTISIISGDGEYFCFAASEDPFHPQGFGQYCGDYGFPDTDENEDIGVNISFEECPAQVQRYINFLTEESK